MKKASIPHIAMIAADAANVDTQYWSSVKPIKFVDNTDPMRPATIVKFIAIPLKLIVKC